MNNQAKTNPYFLLSFIPAVAYWYLEENYDLKTALIGGIILGILEMLFEKKFTGHVHTLSRLNLSLIVVLGVISLIAQEGIWFKMQPTLTGISLASYLVYKKIKGESLMIQTLIDMNQKPPLPVEVYKMLEWHLALFLIGFAFFMMHIALNRPTATWLFWKTGGFYIAFGGFLVVEMIFLAIYFRRKQK